MDTALLSFLDHRTELKEMAAEAIASRLLNQEIKNAAAAYFVMLVGVELGFNPMQALQNIYVIKGKAVLSAAALQALVVRSPNCEYFHLAESTVERCTFKTLRKGHPEPTVISYSIEDAKRARLTNNPTWTAHPAAMLRARCAAALARAVYPDVVMGLYEESEGEEIRRGGEVLDNQVRAARTVASTGDPAPLAHLENRRYQAVEAPAAETPAEPLNPDVASASKEILKQLSERIDQAETNPDLQSIAVELKNKPPAISEEQKQQLTEVYKRRRTELLVAEVIEEATKPDADKQTLTQRAHKIPGLTEAQEAQLAEVLQ